MITRMHLAVLIAVSAITGPALAQPANPTAAQPPTAMQKPSKASHAAEAKSTSASEQPTPGQIRYVTQNRRDLWRASKLEGVDVYNDRNEKIGDISEVLVDRQGKVEAVVIGVGGFLGLGQRDVAVPFDQLRWQVNERQNTVAAPSTQSARDTNTTASTSTTRPAAPEAGTGGMGSTATAPRQNDGHIADTRYDQNRDYPARAVLAGATKDQLKNAPEFQYAK
ncbi:PRC-barrel domain-containing protein [Enterovirga sp. CN4-39]|uniref:PRC-barrel domain-containing protein n=1 Tax=Enterovirga sp. CN4-39 TaxID=3400910 RepID=UPI003C0F0B4D